MIGNISKTVGKSKSVIHIILRKLEETGSCEAKKPPGWPRKTTPRKDSWFGNESKKDRFATATAISKRANANLSIKISRHTISRSLNEINSTKPYISKKNKMCQLKFAEEQWDCVHFNDKSKFNLFVRRSPKERYSPQCTLEE